MKHNGFTMVEMMVVSLLVIGIVGGLYFIFSTGQASWFATDADIRLRNSLRKSLQRISMELRQSRSDQKFVFDNTGVGGSDIVRFSVPIICKADGSLIDSNGDIPNWGAPLNWGCTTLACMDQDQDCSVIEYKYVEYLLNNDQELRREILDAGVNLVKSDLVASGITDFQVTDNGTMVHLSASAQRQGDNNRLLSAQAELDVFLRN